MSDGRKDDDCGDLLAPFGLWFYYATKANIIREMLTVKFTCSTIRA